MGETRSNKAKRDKGSILADTKNLLRVLHPALQHMPKIERIEEDITQGNDGPTPDPNEGGENEE